MLSPLRGQPRNGANPAEAVLPKIGLTSAKSDIDTYEPTPSDRQARQHEPPRCLYMDVRRRGVEGRLRSLEFPVATCIRFGEGQSMKRTAEPEPVCLFLDVCTVLDNSPTTKEQTEDADGPAQSGPSERNPCIIHSSPPPAGKQSGERARGECREGCMCDDKPCVDVFRGSRTDADQSHTA